VLARRSASARRRENACLPVGRGIQKTLTTQKYWIPASAGMTDDGLFRLFTRPLILNFQKMNLICSESSNS
jgi:hypothetical protein